MTDLRELYQEVILDHNRSPRNHGALRDPAGEAEGYNPLCGDKVSVAVNIEGNQISEIMFLGCGCAISQASASLMTEAVKGKSLEEVRKLTLDFYQLVTSSSNPLWEHEEYELLEALGGVREFPIRVKCATLAWHTLEAALDKGIANV